MVFLLFFRVRVYGQNHVPAQGGVLIASNHQSYLDPILLGAGLERPLCYMARDSLFRHPLFGALIRRLNAFPVNQERPGTAVIREAVRRVRAGWCLTIFPEGTRTFDGRFGRIRPGALVIAERGRVPMVPAVIEGAFEAWPRGGRPRPGRISVLFGKPISVEEQARLSRNELVERLQDELVTLRTELRGLRSH
jgi:1-acyl-sn-glycerol-3-phosphate acyltransferase